MCFSDQSEEKHSEMKRKISTSMSRSICKCEAVQRMVNAMWKYDSSKESEEQNNINIEQVFDDFLHGLDTHDDPESFEYIKNELGYCNVSNCDILDKYDEKNRNILNDFFGSEESNYYCKCIMNRIHVYYLHSYDIGHKLSLEETSKMEESSRSRERHRSVRKCMRNPEIAELRHIVSSKPNINVKEIHNRGKQRYNQVKDDDCVYYKQYSFGVEFVYEEKGEEEKEYKDYDDKPIIYVEPRYSCFKEELLSNRTRLSIGQYRNEVRKASVNWKAKYRKRFRSKKGEELQKDHALALMIYANYTSLQYELSKTYRENPKESHPNYYHFGKLLKEAVNKYGQTVNPKHDLDDPLCNDRNRVHIQSFYHGIGEILLPARIIGDHGHGVTISGPLSTSSSLTAAMNFTNMNNGLIMEFGGDHQYNATTKWLGYTKYLPLAWLSDFISILSDR